MEGWSFLAFIALCVGVANSAEFGTYYKPFSAQSLWNSRPVNPVFDPNATVPVSKYINWFPTVQSGAYSTGCFYATVCDPPMTVYGISGGTINEVDGYIYINNVTIPHWPKDSLPATGSDGHLDIVDEAMGLIHSFWQVRRENATGRWVTALYAWAPLNGFGFGNPDHFYQGARAAGVPTSAGIIRSHEANDGNPMFYHALALSMDFNGLSPKNHGFIYPATSADDTYSANYGLVPEGALLMLPSTFNTSKISSLNLRKVAETLKVYGAYVVDRNDGTPYAIYVENGAKFPLSNKTTWDNTVGDELQLIRAALKMVVSAEKFLDGNGNTLVQPYTNQNLISMRGDTRAWSVVYGDAVARYDTWTQSLTFQQTNRSSTIQNWTGNNINRVYWANLRGGVNYTYWVESTANITFRLTIRNDTYNFIDRTLGNGQSYTFIHPGTGYNVLYVNKPAGPAGRVRAFLMETSKMVPPVITQTPYEAYIANKPADECPSGSSDDDGAGAYVYPSAILVIVLAVLSLLQF